MRGPVPLDRHVSPFAPVIYGSCGGMCVGLSGEPWSYNVLAFVGVGLLVHALDAAQTGVRPMRASLLAGIAFGTTANAIALGSVVDLLAQFGHFPPTLSFLTALLCWLGQSAPYAVCGLATALARARGAALTLSFPLALTLGLGTVPQLFPWHVGTTQVDFLWYAQMADLGGEAVLNLMLGIASVALRQVVRPAATARAPALGIFVLSLLVPCGYGLVRLDQVREARARADKIEIGVTQPNVDIDEKHDPARSEQILRNLRDLTRTLEARGAELTVWPETAYPYQLSRRRRTLPVDQRAILGGGVHGPIVIGLVSYGNAPDGREQRYNSAWLARRDGTLGDRADKTRLLAFGEYVPLWALLPPLQRRFASPGFTAGTPAVIATAGTRLGILICYEDLFFGMARSVVQQGAQVLVNMTNDAWFGRGHVPGLHDMMAHLRAIETRRDLVRSVNTGVSSFTLATGETPRKSRIFARTGFLARVRKLTITTLYVQLGDFLTPACGIALMALVLRGRRSPAH